MQAESAELGQQIGGASGSSPVGQGSVGGRQGWQASWTRWIERGGGRGAVNAGAGLVAGSSSSCKGEAEEQHGEGCGAQGGAAPASWAGDGAAERRGSWR